MASLLHTCEPPSLRLQFSLPRRSRLGERPATPSRLQLPHRSRRLAAARAAMTTASDELGKGIAEFYDDSSGLWERIWGDHMHHGFYEAGAPATISGHRAAQIRMVEEALRFATVPGIPFFLPFSSSFVLLSFVVSGHRD